ncbi:MAG: asparaginase [Actinomycetes bacterium]
MSFNFYQSRTQGEILAEVVRHGMVESLHSGHLVMLNADGSIHLQKGAIELPMYGRSSLKAMQAAGMLRSGLKVTPEQLALICASHSGTALHQSVAKSMLTDSGLDESALRNTPDKPLAEEERKNWGEPTRLAQNCSGKHAGMLRTCVINGWDLESYRSPDHPLQIAIKAEFEALTEESVFATTVDGCGAPLFATSTLGLARAFRTMTISDDPIYQEIMGACRANPLLVAGEGRLTTRLMRAIPGLFMKEGAEAVEVATLPDGRTLVFKIVDGSNRAFGPIVQAAFKEWGIDSLDEGVTILGGGEPVGSIRALIA